MFHYLSNQTPISSSNEWNACIIGATTNAGIFSILSLPGSQPGSIKWCQSGILTEPVMSQFCSTKLQRLLIHYSDSTATSPSTAAELAAQHGCHMTGERSARRRDGRLLRYITETSCTLTGMKYIQLQRGSDIVVNNC